MVIMRKLINCLITTAVLAGCLSNIQNAEARPCGSGWLDKLGCTIDPTNPIVLKFIKDQRQQHSRLGKRKIKPELDRFCTDNNLSKISTSTIGKIIKRNNFFFQKQGRSYHDPSSKFALRKLSYKTRVKKSPSAQIPGYVEIDTITLFTEGIKRYVYHALDIQNKFDFAYTYKNLNSSNTVDFIKKMEFILCILINVLFYMHKVNNT